MGDIWGRVLGIFLAVGLLFFIPVLYFSERQETVEQLYLITETTDFVDTVRMTGRLTQENYEDFRSKLNVLPELYEIKMTGRHQRIEVTGQMLYLQNEEFYEKQIEKKLEQEGTYCFYEGDFFRVELIKKSSGLFGKVKHALFSGLSDSGFTQVYYGGMICYDGD